MLKTQICVTRPQCVKFISVKIKPNLIRWSISSKKKLNVQKRVNRVQCKFYFSSDLYFHLKHALRVCRIFNKRQTLYVLQFQTVYTAPTQYICMNLAQNKIFSSRFLVFVKIKILAYSLNIFLQFKYVFTEEQTYSI